jgi:hypothetical protein
MACGFLAAVGLLRGCRGAPARLAARGGRWFGVGPRRFCAVVAPRLVTPGSLRYRKRVVHRIALSVVVLLALAAPAVPPPGSCPMLRATEAGAQREPCTHCPPAAGVAVRPPLPDCCAIHAAPVGQPTATVQRPGGELPLAAVLSRPALAVVVPRTLSPVGRDSRPTGRAHLARSLPLLS